MVALRFFKRNVLNERSWFHYRPLLRPTAGKSVVIKSAIDYVVLTFEQYAELTDWLVEQGLTSHSTQFRSFRRRAELTENKLQNSLILSNEQSIFIDFAYLTLPEHCI